MRAGTRASKDGKKEWMEWIVALVDKETCRREMADGSVHTVNHVALSILAMWSEKRMEDAKKDKVDHQSSSS